MIERYTKKARWFHWIYVAVFLELVLSGLVIFVPWSSLSIVGQWVRLIHRIGAILMVAIPLIYAVLKPKQAYYFVIEAFQWGVDDLEWLKAAPNYYFGGDPRSMPPQGYVNSGMKLYRLAILIGGALFVITGFIMAFLKDIVPPVVFQWSLFVHDFTFIVALCMFFLHVQLGVFHPRMDESLLSIIDGKVSNAYASSHHGKWYDRVRQEKNHADQIVD